MKQSSLCLLSALGGALVGAMVAVLVTPTSGKELRHKIRDAMSEADRQFMTTVIKGDMDVRMGIITDVKQELRRCSALKIMYQARKAE